MSADRVTRSKAKQGNLLVVEKVASQQPKQGNLLIIENDPNKQPKKRGRKPKIQQSIPQNERDMDMDNENEELDFATPLSPEKSIQSTLESGSPALASTRIQTETTFNYTNMSYDDKHKLAIDILEKLNLQKHVANFKQQEVTIEFLVSNKFSNKKIDC